MKKENIRDYFTETISIRIAKADLIVNINFLRWN
jgi:hypothetical protein